MVSKYKWAGNLSWSALNLFLECEKHFMYSKVLKYSTSNSVETKYGHFGNAVHEALEMGIENIEDTWVKYKLYETDMDIEVAKKCVENALKYDFNIEKTERCIEFPYNGVNVKMLIDFETKDGSIGDWKTSTFNIKKVEDYKKQLIWYAWGIWKTENRIVPTCYLVFVKYEDKMFEFKPSESDLIDFENTFIIPTLELYQTKKKFEDFKINLNACHFCGYKSKCMADRIKKQDDLIFDITLDHDFIQINHEITDPIYYKVIQKEYSYEMDNAHFIKKAMFTKGVKNFNTTVSHYKTSGVYDYLPIGFYNSYRKLLTDYSSYLKKRLIIHENDKRIFDRTKLGLKINLKHELREYQKEAAEYFKYRKIGFAEITTGAGKTTIAGAIINEINNKTLFIVDRNILLKQAKDTFEEMFKIEVGTVSEGKQIWKDITIASVQTLTSLIKKGNKEAIKWIGSFNVVFVDEAHGVKSKSYQTIFKYVGAEYRIGLSGTAYSDGNDSLELYKCFGFPDFKITTKDLIEKGYLTPCIVEFLRYDEGEIINGDYNEVYEQVLKSEDRLDKLYNVCNTRDKQNILIICDKIEHINLLADEIEGCYIITGSTSEKKRNDILDHLRVNSGNILIATASIMQKGVDIPNLDVIINYTANLSSVKTRQSLGRVLRTHKDKKIAYYYDFYDTHRSLINHTRKRIETLKEQGFDVK